jgi:hypothetical protein
MVVSPYLGHVQTRLPNRLRLRVSSTHSSLKNHPILNPHPRTKVYTTIIPTLSVTTVCDGPETRVLTRYPTSRLTTVVPATITPGSYHHSKPHYPGYNSGSYAPGAPYPVSAAGYGYPAKGSSQSAEYDAPRYSVKYEEYVASAVAKLKVEYAASGYAEGSAAAYPSAVGYPSGSPAAVSYTHGYGPGILSTSVTSIPYPTHPGSPANPEASRYGYGNVTATATYGGGAGNGTATATGGPVLYTGGASTWDARGVVGGVVGLVVAVLGLGML